MTHHQNVTAAEDQLVQDGRLKPRAGVKRGFLAVDVNDGAPVIKELHSESLSGRHAHALVVCGDEHQTEVTVLPHELLQEGEGRLDAVGVVAHADVFWYAGVTPHAKMCTKQSAGATRGGG